MGEDLCGTEQAVPGAPGPLAAAVSLPRSFIDRHHPVSFTHVAHPQHNSLCFPSQSSSPAVAGVERLGIHSPNW